MQFKNNYTPLHFNMNKEYERVDTVQMVFSFANKDTSSFNDVKLLLDTIGKPLLYFSEIQTPVCIDGLCKPMHIGIYWNLLGSYVGYETFDESPLTKYDHDLFEAADHLKLHQLLSNPNSIIRRKKLSELFDTNSRLTEKVKYKGVEIDGITGATNKEIKSSVVEGALFSCYTIWHLVHGAVTEQMAEHLDSIYDRHLAKAFLYSPYSDYQLYALKHLAAEDFDKYPDAIIDIFNSAKPLTRTYLLKKLPKDRLSSNEKLCAALYSNFSKVDINSRTLLMRLLPYVHLISSELLATQIPSMSKNQLQLFFKNSFRKILNRSQPM